MNYRGPPTLAWAREPPHALACSATCLPPANKPRTRARAQGSIMTLPRTFTHPIDEASPLWEYRDRLSEAHGQARRQLP